MKKVCIDAGHYGKYNRCPGIPEYYESDMTWKLSNLQAVYLRQFGIEVVMTRADKNKDLGLVERGKASKGCDLFLSNHSNAVGGGMDEATDRVAVYHLVNDTTTDCDDRSREFAGIIAPVIAAVMGTKQGYKVYTRQAQSDRNGDGIKNDNYYGVLHGARLVNTPGLILEHSFHTNTAAVRWLLNDANLDKLARAEAEAVASWLLGKAVTLDGVSGDKGQQTAGDTLYRVQVGAFRDRGNADRMYARVKALGFDVYMVQKDGFYKIQVGAYAKYENAERKMANLGAAGFPDAYITTEQGEAVTVSKAQKSLDEIAQEVLAGKWGNGADRRERLTVAGYDYAQVQAKVDKISR